MSEIRLRAAFTLSRSVKEELESAIPKSQRSQFVDKAIASALMERAREEALEAIQHFPRVTPSEDSVETLRRIRQERSEYLADRHRASSK